jgi:NadR type nicotinamide-nucleotide adenylyltransferase
MLWKIAIVGPESSGKTTLAEALARHYGAFWLPDPSRSWLEQHGPAYTEADLVRIAAYHMDLERAALADANARGASLLFCDTDLINYRIWSQVKYGRVNPEIDRLVKEAHYDHSLLCRPDIPWEADPLRENPHDRERLFEEYERNLLERSKSYTIIEGDHQERLHLAFEALTGFASPPS